MKKILPIALTIFLLAGMAGCGGNSNGESAQSTPQQVEVSKKQEKFADETLSEITYQVPSGWDREDAGDGYYYYPTSDSADGFLYVSCQTLSDGQLSLVGDQIDLLFNSYVEGMSTGGINVTDKTYGTQISECPAANIVGTMEIDGSTYALSSNILVTSKQLYSFAIIEPENANSISHYLDTIVNSISVNPDESVAPTEVTVQEQILVEDKGIKITAKGIDSTGTFGAKLKILIENNSDTNLTVQVRSSSINGYMVDSMISCEVAAGKKANDAITFSSTDLETCGIKTIADFEFSFHIFMTDGWDDYLDTPLIQVKTSGADTYTYTFDDTGDILYEGNGIRVISKGLSANESIFGPGVKLFIENTSEQSITVQARDVSVNGFMVNTSLSEEVSPGKRSNTALTIMKSSLEENGISQIENIEFALHIFASSGWDTIVDTDKITINF